jgi:hypothetical protein
MGGELSGNTMRERRVFTYSEAKQESLRVQRSMPGFAEDLQRAHPR